MFKQMPSFIKPLLLVSMVASMAVITGCTKINVQIDGKQIKGKGGKLTSIELEYGEPGGKAVFFKQAPYHARAAHARKLMAEHCYPNDPRFKGWKFSGFKTATNGPDTFEINLRPTQDNPDKGKQVDIIIQGAPDRNTGPGIYIGVVEYGGDSGIVEAIRNSKNTCPPDILEQMRAIHKAKLN